MRDIRKAMLEAKTFLDRPVEPRKLLLTAVEAKILGWDLDNLPPHVVIINKLPLPT